MGFILFLQFFFIMRDGQFNINSCRFSSSGEVNLFSSSLSFRVVQLILFMVCHSLSRFVVISVRRVYVFIVTPFISIHCFPFDSAWLQVYSCYSCMVRWLLFLSAITNRHRRRRYKRRCHCGVLLCSLPFISN